MLLKLFKRAIKVTYGVTVCNEHEELDRLLSALTTLIGKKDSIIVLRDVTIKNDEVTKVIEKYQDLEVIESKLNNDFASFKNNLINSAKGDYLFQIDADEVPKETLIKGLKTVLRKNKKFDCFMVPRINIVYGYTAQHIQKWNWKINDNNYINFPDYQPRIIKLNGNIRWKNKVHEELTGFKKLYNLPTDDETYCLLHIKDIARQEKQNAFYDTL